MEQDNKEIQQELFQYVDQIKELLSPEIWQNVLLDCTKNELFVLWFLYRNTEVNMTQIAEYIHVPLNTATGIISRMEKRNLVVRQHSAEDKRVVTISLGEQGNSQLQAVMQEIMYYISRIFAEITPEESKLLFKLMENVITVLRTKREAVPEKKKIKKITIE